jgi:hypothetical protein
MEHLEKNNLINQSQHGFMPGKSCATNLLEFFEKATRAVDGGKPVDVIFLDFAKAFDKVPRERLLAKLRAHGITGNLLTWIRNWLTGRKQRVVLNSKHSTWSEVLSGVPQGSVLGPILFLVFINDLDQAARLISILSKFADDTKLGHTVQSTEEKQALQQSLNQLCEWAEMWGMAFNVKKCKVLHLGYNNSKQVYTMHGQQLETTEEERDIGVMVSNTLKPSAQCRKAAQTAQAVLGQLARAFHFRDRHIFLRLYMQNVRPHLEFSSPAWSPWLESDKACLEKVQMRAVNMISGLKGRSYEEKLRELGITTLEERRHQLDMTQTYKILTGASKVDSGTWFERASDGIKATRLAADPLNIKQRAARLEIRRNSFSQRVVDDWNKIPSSVKGSVSVNGFKNGYKSLRRDPVVTT